MIRLSALHFAETSGGHSQVPGMVTVELDMIFPEKEYLQMVEEYVICSLWMHVSYQLMLRVNSM